MKYYLAGPMTGIPQFNFPLFQRAAAELRAAGFDIISPAELDSPAVREAALNSVDGYLGKNDKIGGETWGDMLARDVKILADEADGVIVLPNWWRSRGARLEVFVALLCGKGVNAYQDGETTGGIVRQLPYGDVLLGVLRGFLV